MSEIKIGIYLCTCEGAIEKVIALDSLAKETAGWRAVTIVRKDATLCSERGIGSIREDVVKHGLDRVLIAACTPSVKAKEFSDLGINKHLVERVNFREQCSSVHGDNSENATKKAKALLGLSYEKIRYSKPLHSCMVPAVKSALIVGGGVAGINAALDIAGTDVEVFLVEKSPSLGGKVVQLHKYFPRMCPPSCGLEIMLSRLESHPLIHIFTSSEIDSLSGSPGKFEALIRTATTEATNLDKEAVTSKITVGAVIIATGWEPYDPTPLAEYGYGKLEHVVTNLEFEKIVREQKRSLYGPKKTAFIQCVGSRNERQLPYCSDICCMVSIKQALLLKEINPENEVYIFYNDIRTPGEYEDLYRQARMCGIKFIKGMPSELRQGTPGNIFFPVFDTVAGERLEINVDSVVLATGMKSALGNNDLKDKIGIVLNKNNFIESHLQCCPQDTRRAGIFSAGCCRAPMDVSRSIDSAGAAAIKALQFLKSEIEVSPGYPVVNTLKCDVCKRCVEECPNKAYSFDQKGFPIVDILKCSQCGICMGSCPLGSISLGDLSIEQLSGMIDVMDKSYLGDDEPVILGFLCKNDAYRAADDSGSKDICYPPNMLSIMVPCSGAVNGMIVSEAISKGVDGILIAGCPDNQCHYSQGSTLAKARLADVSNKLKDMYIEPERVRFISISRDETEKFVDAVNEYVQVLKKLGRNQMRIQ